MQNLPEGHPKPERMLYVDNIRWLMIVFVILTHAAVTYSGMGSWYYKEPSNLDIASFAVFGMYLSFTQAYSMGLLFLLASYFVPGAFDHKGFGKFVLDRAVRLGIPTLIYMLFINTLIDYYILAFKWSTPRPHPGQAFQHYILSLDFLGGSGPMWFALALLIFTAAYATIRLILNSPDRLHEQEEMDESEAGKLPGHMEVVALGLLISICAFSIRQVLPIGTSVMNMQLCYFSQYIILFIIGVLAYRNNWLSRIPYSFGIAWFKISMIGGSIFWMAIIILGGGLSGDITRYSGGLYWQSAAYALWESFFCVGICLGIIVIFRERFNKQGKFTRFMSKNYFSVYLFHAPILILTALAFRDFSLHPLIKFLIVSAIAVPICFLASHLVFGRVPLLRRVL
ncbi:MAG TPA: acyltransferase family protein [Methanotrichaceae archaeon]|nr:acyltransferase family protein [Methanotrichaceae archaeon]